MRPSNQPYIIIPAYNEAPVIGMVIHDLRKAGYDHIIVIDDGSQDSTHEVAQKAGAVVLRHAVNRGKGASIKTGIAATKILHAASIVTYDGDGQHDPADISKLFASLHKGYDIVLGVRNHHDMPFLKRIANSLANTMTFALYGLWVKDSQCGLRAFSKKAYCSISTQNDRYEYDTEVIREISTQHFTYSEVPVTTRYTKYSMHKKQKQDITNGLKTLFRIILSS